MKYKSIAWSEASIDEIHVYSDIKKSGTSNLINKYKMDKENVNNVVLYFLVLFTSLLFVNFVYMTIF